MAKERQVKHGVRRHGPELPPKAVGGGGGGRKVFEPLLNEVQEIVKAEPEASQEYFGIADYANSSAAIAAANVLRKQLGDNIAVGGWDIQPRRTGEGQTMTLFVRFDPKAVVRGERQAWEKRMAEREAKAEQKRQAKQKESAA